MRGVHSTECDRSPVTAPTTNVSPPGAAQQERERIDAVIWEGVSLVAVTYHIKCLMNQELVALAQTTVSHASTAMKLAKQSTPHSQVPKIILW